MGTRAQLSPHQALKAGRPEALKAGRPEALKAGRPGGLIWAVATAAVLGAVLPAAAQAPAAPPAAAGQPLGPAMHLPGAAGLEAPGLQQDDVRVQLAWLADPLTFPWNLAAQVGPASLEVTGYVPTEAVRQRVLQVAHETCALPVADRLQLHPGMPLPFAGATAAPELRQVVLDYLAQLLGERLRHLQIESDASGRVLVAGTLLSPQEQLQVARSLRMLNGCRAVVYRTEMSPGVGGTWPVVAKPAREEGVESVGMVEWGSATGPAATLPSRPGTPVTAPPLPPR